MREKECRHCGKRFVTKWPHQHYCAAACTRAADLERQRMKDPIWKNCKICEVRFDAYNRHGGAPRTYCSDECRAVGIKRMKRESERRTRNQSPKLCAECNAELSDRRAMRCKPCAQERVAAQQRARNAARPVVRRKPVKLKVGTEKPDRSYHVHERHRGMRAGELAKFITVVPTDNPLPVEPRAALVEALQRFPDLRDEFARVHGL